MPGSIQGDPWLDPGCPKPRHSNRILRHVLTLAGRTTASGHEAPVITYTSTASQGHGAGYLMRGVVEGVWTTVSHEQQMAINKSL